MNGNPTAIIYRERASTIGGMHVYAGERGRFARSERAYWARRRAADRTRRIRLRAARVVAA